MSRSLFTFLVVLLSGTTVHAKLEIANVQAAYGPVGPKRESRVYYAGEEILFRYLLTGVKTNAKFEADLSITTHVTDAFGTAIYEKTTPLKVVMALDGGSMPLAASATLAESLKPGPYRVGVTAKDNLSDQTASFERVVTLHETIFTSINQRFFMDALGRVPGPAAGLVGQSLYFRIGLIGFDPSKGRVEARMELEFLDADKKIISKPSESTYKNDAPTAAVTQVNFGVFVMLNRPGNFTLRVKFTDAVGGRNSQFEVPFEVTEP
jgi:hypothetical protein